MNIRFKTVMKVKYTSRAQKDLENLDECIEEEIREKIRELEDNPASHQDVKMFPLDGREIFRLRIGSRGKDIDHRAVYDIKNSKIIILTVIHRDEGYNEINI